MIKDLFSILQWGNIPNLQSLPTSQTSVQFYLLYHQPCSSPPHKIKDPLTMGLQLNIPHST